jgi:hypothetical protein
MADVTAGGAENTSTAPIFVRKATGLVRGWAMVDGSIYAFYACNIVLGLWVLSFGSFIPNGSLFWAIIICAALTLFQIFTYAALTSAMPRPMPPVPTIAIEFRVVIACPPLRVPAPLHLRRSLRASLPDHRWRRYQSA